jgi:hypothetical protein
MADFLARTSLSYHTGMPGDEAVNTFAFTADGITDGTIPQAFIDFWIADPASGTPSLSTWLSPYVDRGIYSTLQLYTLDVATGDTTPIGTPGVFAPDASGNANSLPLETAVCLSYAAAPGAASKPARGRGRIFVGPLNGAAITTSDSAPTVNQTLIDTMALAATKLINDLNDAGATWCVWSRADAALYEITSGWIDNEFDTMRSRQVDATSRSTYP